MKKGAAPILRWAKKGAGPFLLGLVLAAEAAWAAPAMTVTVTGTIDDPAATVSVNGIPATNFGGTFTATSVPLELGPNAITAVAIDPAGNRAELSISVRVDVRFTVQGTVNEPVASLTVNGVTAAVGGGTFQAAVPLPLGLNTLTATGTDPSGNTDSKAIEVFVARHPIDHP